METPTGAPLKLRSDWKERPRSKDLIIDLPGKMPVAEIEEDPKESGSISFHQEEASQRL